MRDILFVDDEKSFLDGIQRLLRRHADEWRPWFALSADQALNMIRTHDFQAVVSDVSMPGKSGIDLLDTLQADPATRTIPVVILTGSLDADLKRTALEKGAADLLNKPVAYEDLVARLKSTLRLKSFQDELMRHNQILEKAVRERTAQLEYLHQDLIWRLAKAGEFRDEETGDHVIRVANYSRLIAGAVGLPQKEIDLIFFTAPLHDLGKIGIPDNILLKKGPLDDRERRIMETHCEIGASILLENPKSTEAILSAKGMDADRFLSEDEIRQTAAIIAMSHHERWNGTGYPNRLKGDKIPIQGRIVAFADVYDALCSRRSYKGAYSPSEAWRVLEWESGSHFDPHIFKAIAGKQDEFKEILRKFNR